MTTDKLTGALAVIEDAFISQHRAETCRFIDEKHQKEAMKGARRLRRKALALCREIREAVPENLSSALAHTIFDPNEFSDDRAALETLEDAATLLLKITEKKND